MNMEKWKKSFGPGQFTAGAKFLCFLPEGADNYIKIAQAPIGKEDTPEWTEFADLLIAHLNSLR